LVWDCSGKEEKNEKKSDDREEFTKNLNSNSMQRIVLERKG